QMSLTGTPASACLRIETIWVSVNFDFFMEPPGWENMPESSTFVVSADQGSLRMHHHAKCRVGRLAGWQCRAPFRQGTGQATRALRHGEERMVLAQAKGSADSIEA